MTDIDTDKAMRFLIFMVLGLVGLSTGCSSPSPQTLVQSALAGTHLGWQQAPENQLSFSLATATGIARVALRPLPPNLEVLTLSLPGMDAVEGVQWRGEDGNEAMLLNNGRGEDGVLLQQLRRGFRLQISGGALELVRGGGQLTVIDRYRN
ncbi:hypothetical protein [Microbulbifer sp. TYP-18]|uniref:hypothetical protein n=1 Tax=Microbulbifer sp. TYP-18 TaxID=3230024 RepID=UPI0034C6BF5A